MINEMERGNMKKKLAVINSLGFILLVFFDQITKFLVRNYIVNKPLKIWNGVFSFTYLENRGSVWGIMQGKRIFLLITTFFLCALLVYIYVKIPKEKKYTPLLWLDTFMLAGAVGNAIDRFFMGYVTDFIYVEIINFPIFNVADCYITCTCVITCILLFTKYKDDNFSFLFKAKKHEDVNE